MPRAVYRICGIDADHPGRSVLVHKKKALFLPQQAAKPLLCSGCEDRLSRNGETYVIGQCMRSDGDFNLRERIQEARESEPHVSAIGFSLRRLEGAYAEHYVYFSVSMFWRAAVTAWRLADSTIGRISLGTQLEEGFRLWLLGEAPFPGGAALGLSVFQGAGIPPLAFFPIRDKAHPFAMYRVGIPGMQFCMWIDEALTGDLVDISRTLPGDIPVFLESFWKSGLADIATRAAKESSQKGRLKRLIEGDGSA